MKKQIIAIAFTLLSGITFAQEVTIENVPALWFTGVNSFNGEYNYTLYNSGKPEKTGIVSFILGIYDKDLKEINKTEFEISKRSKLAASCFNGNTFLFIFADASEGVRTTVTFDKNGNLIKKEIEEKLRFRVLADDNYPEIHGLPNDEFLIIQPQKEKKFGYEVERINKDLSSIYKKSFFPTKGMWTIEDSKLKNGVVYMLRDDKITMLSSRHEYTVQAMNVENGEVIYSASLINDGDGGFPDFLSVDDKGLVATGGMYFKDSKYDETNSDGLFFALIAADGTTQKFSKTSWKSVKEKIKGEFSSTLIGGKTKVLIEDLIQKKDGTYLVVGETWRKSNNEGNTGLGALTSMGGLGGGSSSSSGDKGFTVMDFAFFNFDATGDLTSIDKIEKETREAIITGPLAKENGLAIAKQLYKRKFFCYRSSIEVEGEQYLMYKNVDGIKTKAYFMPVGATSSKGLGSIDMDKWVSEGLNSLGKLSKITNGNKATFGNSELGVPAPELYKNIVPAGPGKVLLYQLHKGNLYVWIQPVPKPVQ